MINNELRKLFNDLFKINIKDLKYRDFDFEKKFQKKISKLKGQEVYNILSKIIEILNSNDLNHYKNLRYDLKKYKRVHVNNSYVIIFYDNLNKKVYFIDYEHHNKIYKN